jgi:hypothetical protein
MISRDYRTRYSIGWGWVGWHIAYESELRGSNQGSLLACFLLVLRECVRFPPCLAKTMFSLSYPTPGTGRGAKQGIQFVTH